MFTGHHAIRVTGYKAEILAAYAPAATLYDWTITKVAGTWTLTAAARAVNPVLLRGVLRFAAPRPGGFWYWPIAGTVTVTNGRLTATLGKPE